MSSVLAWRGNGPIAKMRDYVHAIRAVWDCWQHGEPLRYEGEFFLLRLMTPFFNPGPNDVPYPPIYVSAVNKMMLNLAGEVCDGVHLHAIHSAKYMKEFALPHLEAGMAKSGRKREDFAVNTAVFAIPSDDPQYAQWAEGFVKQQISFYMSTPAYRVLSELHGWEDTAKQLSQMARDGEWDEMPKLINDDILSTVAISGKWAELPTLIQERYGNILDRVSYYLPFVPGENEEGWKASIAGFKNL